MSVTFLTNEDMADIDERFDSLNEEIDKLKGEDDDGFEDLTNVLQANWCRVIYWAIGEAPPVEYLTENPRAYGEIPCVAGDVFEIKGVGVEGNGLWTFVDANGIVLTKNAYSDMVNDGTYNSPITITAPENAAQLLVVFDTSYDGSYIHRIQKAKRAAYPYVMPKWAAVEPFAQKDYKREQDFANFSAVYQAFHALTYNDLTASLQDGKCRIIYQSVGTTPPAAYDSTGRAYAEINCASGDVFEIKGVGVSDGGFWSFVDANGAILSKNEYGDMANVATYNTPVTITAPEGAAQLLVVFDTAYADSYIHKDDGLIEEINMSTDYLAANPTDALPSAISEITNGGMYMWHVNPPVSDTTNFTPKYTRAKIMLLGGIHGSEKKSIWNLYHMLKDIQDGANSRAIHILRNFFDIYVVPMCCPYAIEHNSRTNENGVNLNRDFYVSDWATTTDSGETYNSQYETRCISWWFDQIRPDIFCDHHTSTGDNSSEFSGEHFLAWGDSKNAVINSVIEETLIDLSPEIRMEYPEYFSNYDMVYGFVANPDSYKNMGISTYYAHEKGAIACTFEVVLVVWWDGLKIIGTADDEHTDLMTIDYYLWLNFLMRYLRQSVDILNA